MREQHAQDPLSESFAEPTRFEASSALPSSLRAQIEDYLDRRFAPLVDSVAYEARQKQRAELRDHLYAAIRAHMELGSPPEEAVSAALRHTGGLGTTVHTVSRRQTRREPSARWATLLATILFGLPWLADNTRFAARLWDAWVRPFDSQVEAISKANEAPFYRFELFIVPLVAGLLVGLLARHRSVRGVLNGLALLTIPAILLPGFVDGLIFVGFLSQEAHLGWLPSPVPAVIGLTYWVAMGCAGAGIGSRLRGLGRRFIARRRSRLLS